MAAASNSFSDLLGPKLLTKDGESDIESQNLGDNDAIGLYFSAHWCGPCRGFTPQLVKWYTGMREAGKKFQIVFVSSDKDDDAFTGYYEEQPWLALPFADRTRKEKLSKKFKVRGIPTLVIIDAKTGETITDGGRAAISSDPTGEHFPWHPKSFWDILDNGHIITKDGEVPATDLKDKVIGLYFSAHWCPPCRQFTPKLAETYDKIKGDGKNLEVIFASGDRKESEFDEYYAEQPWTTLPFGDKRIEELNSLYGISGIPSLVIVDGATGRTITDSGRSAISGDPTGEDFPWKPKPLNELIGATAGNINELPCCIVFINDDGKEDALVNAIRPVAEEICKAREAGTDKSELEFFYAKKDPIVGRIRQLLGDKLKDTHCLAVLSVPDGGIYLSDVDVDSISVDVVRQFVADFQAEKLEKTSLQ